MNNILKTVSVTLMAVLLLMSSALLVFSHAFYTPQEIPQNEEVTTVTDYREIETKPLIAETTAAEQKIMNTFEIMNIKGGDPLCDHTWPFWIETSPPDIGRAGMGLSYCPSCGAARTKYLEPLPDPDERYSLDVENILQNPELPNGCEIVSLAIVLRYLGFEVDPVELSDKYLEKGKFGEDTPFKKYIGDPKTNMGTGCYAPCIVKAANNFLDDNNSELSCIDVSGKSLDELQAYVDEGIPVIIWGTVFMDCSPDICFSYWYETGWVTWYSHSHCLVMTGHSKSTYIFADPLYGIANYDRESVRISYNQAYQQACIIK